MIRSLWMAVSTMAVANLLALGVVAAWLQASGRLNAERIEKVRLLFSTTIAQDEAAAASLAEEARVLEAAAIAQAKVGTTPLNAEQRLDGRASKEEVETQQARRVQRETADLINTLLREREELDRQRADFQAQVDAFGAMRARIAQEEGSEQFQKAVGLYQSVRPGEAKNMMGSLIAAGKKDQVVSYLNALAPRVSAKIIAEFEKDDPASAADLLERLRTLGTAIAIPGSEATKPVAAASPQEP